MTDAEAATELRSLLAWLTDRNAYPTRMKSAVKRAIEKLDPPIPASAFQPSMQTTTNLPKPKP